MNRKLKINFKKFLKLVHFLRMKLLLFVTRDYLGNGYNQRGGGIIKGAWLVLCRNIYNARITEESLTYKKKSLIFFLSKNEPLKR